MIINGRVYLMIVIVIYNFGRFNGFVIIKWRYENVMENNYIIWLKICSEIMLLYEYNILDLLWLSIDLNLW